MKLNLRVFRTMMLSALLLVGIAAEARVVTGTVKDPTGETIISASVMVKGTTIGTVTDFDGNYTIDVPEDGKVLIFSYIGMKTQELNITGDVMNVVLSENSEVLEEVVVTGYGTTKKRDLVTAVASVSADQLKDVPVASAAEALQGKLAGVSVTTAEGSPDAEVKIRVRGGTSLTQSNDPLYIVDGFPVSSISDIAPSDIASMDVLKDAAATAIYGSQGANGVIIITTKDASTDNDDKMVIHADYTGYVGWKWLTKEMDVMDNREFMLMQYENAYMKGKLKDKFWPFFVKDYNSDMDPHINEMLASANELEYTDWQNKTFGRTGFDSNHSFSVSGGNKNGNFNLSYNRVDNKAIMYGSDYSRDNIALKAKFKPIKNMTIAFNTRFSSTRVNGAGTNTTKDAGSTSESRLRNAVQYTPMTLYSKDANSLDDEDSYGGLYDPLTTIDDNYKFKKDVKFNMNGYISYKFAKYFTWRSEIGYDYRDVNTNRFYGTTTYLARTNCLGKSAAVQAMEKYSKFRQTNTFNYNQSIENAHNINVTLGEEIIMAKGETRTMTGVGYESKLKGPDVFNQLSNCASTSYTNYINPTDNTLSFFARADYNYKSRYYASFTFRADGSTRFASKNQWGFFPSGAVAWNIAEESFMESAQSWLSQLKLRFSYGTAGNNNINLGYLHTDFLSSIAGESTSTVPWMSGFTNMLVVGGSQKIAANPNLKWETTITRNLALDYGFFNQRLSGSLEFYLNTTKDLLVLYPLSMGYNYQYRNIGSTENKGIEFSVTGVALDHRSSNLHYNLTISANIAANRTKIVSLGDVSEMPAATNAFSTTTITLNEFLARPGGLVGDIYGFESEGWYTGSDFSSYSFSSDKYQFELKDGVTIPHESMGGKDGAFPGMIKLKDQNGDGKIDDADRVKLGNTMPKCQGGFSLNFNIGGKKWGQVDLGANFTYTIGNDVLNLNKVLFETITNADEKTSYRNLTTTMNHGNRYSIMDANGTDLIQEFQKNYPAGPDRPAMVLADLDAANANAKIHSPLMSAYVVTQDAVEDGSFLRLNQLTLGYSLAEDWLKKAHIQKLRVYVQVANVFCLTKYSGFDPEVDVFSSKNPMMPGVDFSAYPRTRGVNVGLNLSF